MRKHRARRQAQSARPNVKAPPAAPPQAKPDTKPRAQRNLPQDSILRAHLRRQADWSEDGPRLCRRPEGTTRRNELLAEIDRIGNRNRVRRTGN